MILIEQLQPGDLVPVFGYGVAIGFSACAILSLAVGWAVRVLIRDVSEAV